MKTKYKIIMAGLVIALVSTGMLWAQQRPDEGEVQDRFERIEAEPHPGPPQREQAPRPEFEPREPAEGIEKVRAKIAELKEAAELADREGQPEKAAQMREKAKKLAEEIEAFAQKAKGRMPAEAKQRVEQLRDMARQAKERGEMEKSSQLWAEAEELERTLKREFEHRPQPPGPPKAGWEGREIERRWPRPMEIEPRRERIRERPEPPGPGANLERMQKELHDVLAEHLERMANQFRELQMHVERLERELQQLRAENERLRSQLHERPW